MKRTAKEKDSRNLRAASLKAIRSGKKRRSESQEKGDMRLAVHTRDLKKILKKASCKFVRPGKGDHEIWYSPISRINFTVDSDIKSRHTANEVLKQAGLEKQF
jgi:hypothetical protein